MTCRPSNLIYSSWCTDSTSAIVPCTLTYPRSLACSLLSSLPAPTHPSTNVVQKRRIFCVICCRHSGHVARFGEHCVGGVVWWGGMKWTGRDALGVESMVKG